MTYDRVLNTKRCTLDLAIRKLGIVKSYVLYKNMKKSEQYAIIDKLVEKLKDNKQANIAYYALLQIFKPLIYKIIGIYVPRFATLSYTKEDVKSIVYAEFYTLTAHVYIPENKDGHRAKFNRFIQKKLNDRMYCLWSKEKTIKKYDEFISNGYITPDRICEDSELNRLLTNYDINEMSDILKTHAKWKGFSNLERNIINDIANKYPRDMILERNKITINKYIAMVLKLKNQIKEHERI